ncbi:hypothetical protein KJ780_02220 [Candidatus Micrarchaeota archaeon]|nr:hypothetical protein [Candidatus Micrarchaeota archaeon]
MSFQKKSIKEDIKASPILEYPTELFQFTKQLDNLEKIGLLEYVKENIPTFWKPASSESAKSVPQLVHKTEGRQPQIASFKHQPIKITEKPSEQLDWIKKNPKLLGQFKSDLHNQDIVLSSESNFQSLSKDEQLNTILRMWLSSKYATAKYAPNKEIPKAGITICAEKDNIPGPTAILHLASLKPSKDSSLTQPKFTTSLAFISSPQLFGYIQDNLKKSTFETEFFTRYLMRINSITDPNVRAKIRDIFLSLGALIRADPDLAFPDFVSEFVVGMNKEFGSNLFEGMVKRDSRDKGKKAKKLKTSKPKIDSGGGDDGKPSK